MKFKTKFSIPTPDFKKFENKLLEVTMPEPENLIDAEFIEYRVDIPDFMFNDLKDTEPQFETFYNFNNRVHSGCFSERSVRRKFKKSQTSSSLKVLKDYIFQLSNFLLNKHSLETSSIKKKIFIKFNNTETHKRNEANGAYNGLEISQQFSYFIGYEVLTDKFSGINKKVEKIYISKICYASGSATKYDTGFKEKEDLFLPLTAQYQSIKDFEDKYSIIDWSKEREEFCEKIQNSFINLGKELSGFLKNISEEKFELLMQSNIKLLNQ